ncbi:hypothetical protein FNF31_07463 [Cafeteria roenbergensis]|uniref:Uncharacterized protein n=1 Tax=Cafeteria roenbergensis TaxID=33653 RepID=A0A5A8C8H9_CAFRO|nr:hypothetical protein FNF31_07463 [Cafeteria roenbergensis]KAA0157800.1 hypothetical protein FNF28_06509 [Cafeteria roenbergensis]
MRRLALCLTAGLALGALSCGLAAPARRARAREPTDGAPSLLQEQAHASSGRGPVLDVGYMAQVLQHQRGRFRGTPVQKRAVPLPPVDPMEYEGGVQPVHSGVDPEILKAMYSQGVMADTDHALDGFGQASSHDSEGSHSLDESESSQQDGDADEDGASGEDQNAVEVSEQRAESIQQQQSEALDEELDANTLDSEGEGDEDGDLDEGLDGTGGVQTVRQSGSGGSGGDESRTSGGNADGGQQRTGLDRVNHDEGNIDVGDVDEEDEDGYDEDANGGGGGSLLQAGAKDGPLEDLDVIQAVASTQLASRSEDSLDTVARVQQGLPRPHGLWTRFPALRGTPLSPVDPQSYQGGVRQLTLKDVRPFQPSSNPLSKLGLGLLQTEASRPGSRHSASHGHAAGSHRHSVGHKAGHAASLGSQDRVSVSGTRSAVQAPVPAVRVRPDLVPGPGERLVAWGLDSLPPPADHVSRRHHHSSRRQAPAVPGDSEMRFAQRRGVAAGFGQRPSFDNLRQERQQQMQQQQEQQAQHEQQMQQMQQQAPPPAPQQPPPLSAAPLPPPSMPRFADDMSTTTLPDDASFQRFRSVIDLGVLSPVPQDGVEAMRRTLQAQQQGAPTSQAPGSVASLLSGSTLSGLQQLDLPRDLASQLGAVSTVAAAGQLPRFASQRLTAQQQAQQQVQQQFQQQFHQQFQQLQSQTQQQRQQQPFQQQFHQQFQQPFQQQQQQQWAMQQHPAQAFWQQARAARFAGSPPQQQQQQQQQQLQAPPALDAGLAPMGPLVLPSAEATPGGIAVGTVGPMDMRAAADGSSLSSAPAPAAPAQRFRQAAAAPAAPEAPPAPTASERVAALSESTRALASGTSVRSFRDALSSIGLGAGHQSLLQVGKSGERK